ncbi:MAG: hypothetical protein ACREO3_10645 [Arenimonas sp.]
MRTFLLVPILVVAAFVAAPASACGEGIFSMGEGLRYDGYQAPRPATVLVYEPDGDASAERIDIYRGLVRAGHKVTVVTDSKLLPKALARESFDIVVADDRYAAELALATGLSNDFGARQLLVVPNKPARGGSSSGKAFVRGTASLGTWINALNRLMKN